jgi:hypothetical protein
MAYRYADAAQTMVTDGQGKFLAANSATIAAYLAGEPSEGIAGGTIAPFQRWADLATAKAALLADIEQRAKALRYAVAGTDDAAKLAVYQQKYEVAVAALANDAAALAALAPEAAARGESAATLAALVKSLGDSWRTAGLAIDAAYQTHKAAINALADVAAAEAYSVSTGWPSL